MKKITLEIVAFLFVAMFAFQTNAQGQFWTKEGFYKIGARGTDPALFMTANLSNGKLEWAAASDDPLKVQEWAIVNHRTPASAGFMEIYAKHDQAGTLTMCTTDALIEKDENDLPTKNITLTFEVREPKSVAAPSDTGQVDGNGNPILDYSGDLSGHDQFQRRKAKVDANGDADSSGSNPAGTQNNALFIKVPGQGGSRFGVTPTAEGDAVQFDGGGIDVIDYVFVRDLATASVNDFGANAFSISNPLNNELVVKGATSKVNEISLYSILGGKVLTKIVNTQSAINLDVSSLASGLYIVELKGDAGRFTQKLIKQ